METDKYHGRGQYPVVLSFAAGLNGWNCGPCALTADGRMGTDPDARKREEVLIGPPPAPIRIPCSHCGQDLYVKCECGRRLYCPACGGEI